MEKNKIKLLFYGDSPTCKTGFAKVSENILRRLQETGDYDITVVGINYFGEPHDLPYKIWPAGINNQNDVYGRQKLLDILRKSFSDPIHNDRSFDVLFTLQDTFIMATIGEHIKKLRDGHIQEIDGKKTLVRGKNFKWIYYYPIDAKPKKEWIEKSVKFVDIAVPYTKYAEKESKAILDRKYEVIYHGFDSKEFYPLSDEEKDAFRNKYFKSHNLKDNFFICNVNRNQERKGLFQTLIAFKLFNSIFSNSILYTHCDVENDRGGNLIEVAKQLGIHSHWIYPNPETFKAGYSFPTEYINGVYNIADANISTTHGEGFGLSLIEAMATKTLNIFPDNTAISELLADGRGLLVDSGKDPNHLVMNGPLDNNLIRPTTDVKDMVNKLLWALRNREECSKIEEKSFQWAVENMNWDKIANEFDELIKNSLK